jgi:hypothetical protein
MVSYGIKMKVSDHIMRYGHIDCVRQLFLNICANIYRDTQDLTWRILTTSVYIHNVYKHYFNLKSFRHI